MLHIPTRILDKMPNRIRDKRSLHELQGGFLGSPGISQSAMDYFISRKEHNTMFYEEVIFYHLPCYLKFSRETISIKILQECILFSSRNLE